MSIYGVTGYLDNIILPLVNTLSNDKIQDLSKFKAFADNSTVAKNKKIFYSNEETVGKGEICFLLFPTMFSKSFFLRLIKTQDFMVKGEGFDDHRVNANAADQNYPHVSIISLTLYQTTKI